MDILTEGRGIRTIRSGIAAVVFLLIFTCLAVSQPAAFSFKFNVYAIPPGIALLCDIALLVSFTRLKIRSSAILFFSLFLLTLAFYAGAEFLQRLSGNATGALFWQNIFASARILLPAAFLAFTLNYLRKDTLKDGTLLLFFLASGLIMIFLATSTDAFFLHDVSKLQLRPWGYQAPIRPLYGVFLLWLEAFFLTALFLLWQRLKHARQDQERKQIWLIMLSVIIPLVGGTITEGVLPVIGLDVLPPVAMELTAISVFIVAYAMRTYSLFIINPATVAENILETTREGIIVLNTAKRIEYLNPRAAELIKAEPDVALGAEIDGFLESPLRFFSGMGPSAQAEHTVLVAADRQHIPVSISASHFLNAESGRLSGYILAITDITNLTAKVEQIRKQNELLQNLSQQLEQEKESVERKVVERTFELHQEHAKLLASINSLDLGVIMTDTRLTVVNSNAITRTILRTEDELQSLQELEKRYPELKLQSVAESALKEKQSAPSFVAQLDNRYLRVFISPIIFNDTAVGTVILIQDITEATILERSKEEFFTIASHELRTPLAAIRGYISFANELNEQTYNVDQFRHIFTNLEKSSQRLIGIVNSFLDMSRLEQGRLTYSFEWIDPVAVITEVLREMQGLAHERSLHLTLAPQTEVVPNVWTDKTKLREILVNLLSNAIKYTEHGGVIVYLEPAADGRSVRIEVEDSGLGISVENQKLLFHKFQQAGSDLLTRETPQGTGLGLYISRLMAEQMGGTLSLLYSVHGKGSVFALSLPTATPDTKSSLPSNGTGA